MERKENDANSSDCSPQGTPAPARSLRTWHLAFKRAIETGGGYVPACGESCHICEFVQRKFPELAALASLPAPLSEVVGLIPMLRGRGCDQDEIKCRVDLVGDWISWCDGCLMAEAADMLVKPRPAPETPAPARKMLRTEAERETWTAGYETAFKEWKAWGVIEVAIRNPSVNDYMNHWEGRALKAEAALASAFPTGVPLSLRLPSVSAASLPEHDPNVGRVEHQTTNAANQLLRPAPEDEPMEKAQDGECPRCWLPAGHEGPCDHPTLETASGDPVGLAVKYALALMEGQADVSASGSATLIRRHMMFIRYLHERVIAGLSPEVSAAQGDGPKPVPPRVESES